MKRIAENVYDFERLRKSDAVRKSFADVFLAIIVFAGTIGILSWWAFPILHPGTWHDVATGAGVRPAAEPVNGLYRMIMALLAWKIPVGDLLQMLPWMGRAAIAGCATFVFLIFRDVLPASLRLKAHMGRLALNIGRLIAVVAAMLFLSGEPIWRAGQSFTPVTLFLFLTALTFYLFFRFLRRGSVASLYSVSVLLAVISSITPIGMVLTIVGVSGLLIAVNKAANPDIPLVNPLVDQLVRVVVFRRLTTIWFVSFVAGIALNIAMFAWQDGLKAGNIGEVLSVVFVCMKSLCSATTSSSSGSGWLFALLFGMIPFGVAVRLLPRAWDEDHFLPYSVGFAYVAFGALSLIPFTVSHKLHYWSWAGNGALVSSDMLLSFFLLFSLSGVAFAMTVLGIDACCRNYRRIAQQQFPESLTEEGPARLAESLGKARAWRRRLFWCFVLVIPFVTLPGRHLTMERLMMKVMGDFIQETVRETGRADVVFTDGSYDDALALESAKEGRAINWISLLDKNTPYQKFLRLRAAESEEDRTVLGISAPTALRGWMASKSPRLERTAFQAGFESFKTEQVKSSNHSGMIAMMNKDGIDEAERKRAKDAVHAIANDIFYLAKTYSPSACSDVKVKELYPVVPWRLSRLAIFRSRVAANEKNAEVSYDESMFADELNDVNYSIVNLRRESKWISSKTSTGVLTPREGLVIGLARADFALAASFAAPILKSDPDDPRANFALGMMFFVEEQFARAEVHLRKCLVKRPDDGAVLNNLAIVLMKLGKYDEALPFAEKAVKLFPNLSEVNGTLQRIKKLKAESTK